MPVPSLERVKARFATDAFNPSHSMWLRGGLDFFEAGDGTLFAYKQVGEVVLLALEPLGAGAASLLASWQEFRCAVPASVYAFLAVGNGFATQLENLGFTRLRVGQEPWLQARHALPTGNPGKGVRSARNKAILAGVTVEDWTQRLRGGDEVAMEALSRVLADWRSQNIIEVCGFLNAVAPFTGKELRRYYVAQRGGKPVGFLACAPIPAVRGFFIEDMVLAAGAPNGTGELLTVEALGALAAEGVGPCSLGIVAVTGLEGGEAPRVPGLVKFLTQKAPQILRKLYNFDGLELYRKRFKPERWEDVNLCLLNAAPAERSDLRAWLSVFWALVRAFEIRAQPSPRRVLGALLRPMMRWPVSTVTALAHGLSFLFVNGGADLPSAALSRFAFTASAPLASWPLRSFASDLLYFDRSHFMATAVPLALLVRWAERSHGTRFMAVALPLAMVMDDVVNYLLLVMPLQVFKADLFTSLVSVKDVGSSLVLSFIVGLQLCQLRRLRELLLTSLAIGAILAVIYGSGRWESLAQNLNHAVFLLMGFAVGKIEFEVRRSASRRAAKGKPLRAVGAVTEPAKTCESPSRKRA